MNLLIQGFLKKKNNFITTGADENKKRGARI